MPHVSAGRLGESESRRHTAAGAGRHVGHFPDVHAATKAGAADASALRKADEAHRPIPVEVWKRLTANADDPDYARGLYDRLGAAGTAGLIKAALADMDHLAVVQTSLGVASHHLTMNEKWLHDMLDEALREGVRDDAVRVLAQAGLGHRARVALGHLGLTEMVHTQTTGTTGQHGTSEPDTAADPAAVRANAERLAVFHAARPYEAPA